jgi:hypothetical protein
MVGWWSPLSTLQFDCSAVERQETVCLDNRPTNQQHTNESTSPASIARSDLRRQPELESHGQLAAEGGDNRKARFAAGVDS